MINVKSLKLVQNRGNGGRTGSCPGQDPAGHCSRAFTYILHTYIYTLFLLIDTQIGDCVDDPPKFP